MATVNIAAGASIQSAIDANPTGTTFQLAAGVYRGQQLLAKSNDQFIGEPGGGTVLSGSIVLTGWSPSGNYWKVSGLPAPRIGQSVGGSNPLSSDLNDLFIDNKLYQRVGSLAQVSAGKWYFDSSTNSAYISDNPTGHTVEYSATPNLTYDNGATGVVLSNLTVQMYANDAQTGPIHGVRGWQINNVTSQFNHGAGLCIAAGTVVQGGHYVDNGQEGITGSWADGAQVLNAEIARNNYAGYNTEWDAGGLKLTNTNGATISGDNVHDNYGNGLWADIDSSNFTFSNNTVANNAGNGIMYEISHGATHITNNTLTANAGSGVYVSNSDGVEASGNTVTVGANNVPGIAGAAGGGGIDIINAARGSGPSGVYESRNDNVHDNTIIHSTDSAKDGIYVYQAISSQNNTWNNNTYYVPSSTGSFWHFDSSDYTWASLHQNTAYESTGTDNIGTPSNPQPPGAVNLFTSSQTPATVTDPEVNTLELGVKFQASQAGTVSGIRFYKGPQNTGVHTGELWDNTGKLLATATFANETSSGWQDVSFSAPVSISANTTYVASYHTNVGHYSDTDNFFNNQYTNGLLTAPASSASGGNGVYAQGSSSVFPTSTYQAANYWVDVDFNSSGSPPPPPPPPPDDTLVLNLSEDYYNGDAKAQLFVDGQPYGSQITVTARHSSGAVQHTNVSLASIAAGSHTIGVEFTNDLYGGTARTDRNLYVNPIQVGTQSGTSVINTTTYGSGTQVLASTGNMATFNNVLISH